MGKNSFKSIIRDRYKGRGNCWVRVDSENQVYSKVINALPKNEPEVQTYISHIEREGFAWIRFSKAEGFESNPITVFEVRYKGSKIDHPDTLLKISDNEAQSLKLLGNTPVKLQIEIFPADRISKRKKQTETLNSVRKRKNNKSLDEDLNFSTEMLDIQINKVKETALGKANPYELKAWEKFLEVEGLLDDTI